jgi:hypothetical protein
VIEQVIMAGTWLLIFRERQTGFLVVLPDLMKGYAFSTDVLQKPTGIVQSIVQKAKFAGLIYSFGILRLNLKDKDVLDSGLAVIQDLRSNYGIQSIGVHGKKQIVCSMHAQIWLG